MKDYNYLIEENAKLVKLKLSEDPSFFENLAKGQQPRFLWIGCSDSRVPANEVTGTEAGDIFVHRNIANLVTSTDMNLMSVLSYAVTYLKVKHVIVCGHYGCGGVQAAMTTDDFGIINKWVRPIKDTYEKNRKELESITSDEERFNRMVELNVMDQVVNLAKTEIIQQEWKKRDVYIHGWAYNLKTGLINDLKQEIKNAEALPEIYRLKV